MPSCADIPDRSRSLSNGSDGGVMSPDEVSVLLGEIKDECAVVQSVYRTADGTMDSKFVEKHGRKQFQLYLRPIINGVGHYYVEAETRDETRTDLIINYNNHEYVIELKIWRGNAYNERGEEQLTGYLEHFDLQTGYLLSFCFNKDKRPGLLPPVQFNGRTLIEAIV